MSGAFNTDAYEKIKLLYKRLKCTHWSLCSEGNYLVHSGYHEVYGRVGTSVCRGCMRKWQHLLP